jgi:hypothetical protein
MRFLCLVLVVKGYLGSRVCLSVSLPTVNTAWEIWYEFGLNVLRNCSFPLKPWLALIDRNRPQSLASRTPSTAGLSNFSDRVIYPYVCAVCKLCTHGRNWRFKHLEIKICWVQGCNSQLNSVQILAYCLNKINFNIILASAPLRLSWPLCSGFPSRIL